MAVAMFLMAIGLFLLPLGHGRTVAFGYAILMGTAAGIVTVAFFVCWGKVFGRRHLGAIQGAAQALPCFHPQPVRCCWPCPSSDITEQHPCFTSRRRSSRCLESPAHWCASRCWKLHQRTRRFDAREAMVYELDAMIITIDGPAGTGKSTVAQLLAERLGFDFLDTGAMYRAVALEAVRRQCDLANARSLAFVAKHCRIRFDWQKKPPAVLLNSEPVGHLLRGSEVMRGCLVCCRRAAGARADGPRAAADRPRAREPRDRGARPGDGRLSRCRVENLSSRIRRRACPAARRKAPRPRRNRRSQDRPHRDRRTRPARRRSIGGAVAVPSGAEKIDTTSLTQEQVIGRIMAIVEARRRQ